MNHATRLIEPDFKGDPDHPILTVHEISHDLRSVHICLLAIASDGLSEKWTDRLHSRWVALADGVKRLERQMHHRGMLS